MTDSSTPLGRLIDSAKEANGWSDYDLARRANSAGHQISKSKIAEMRTAELRTIVPARLRAIASALAVPISEVVRAAIASADLPTLSASASPEHAIRSDPELPESTKRQLILLIEDARRHRRDESNLVRLSDRRGTVPDTDAELRPVAFRGDESDEQNVKRKAREVREEYERNRPDDDA